MRLCLVRRLQAASCATEDMDIFCPSRFGERSAMSEAPSGILGDLQDLLAQGLTADPGQPLPAKVNLHEAVSLT